VGELIDAAHAHGLKVIFDLVLNHTSDEHAWFTQSRANRDNPKADWYVWHDGRRGPLTWLTGRRRPPNNWRATLDLTSAWQWREARSQYYLASFLPFQPDLNWRNPDVKAAMFDAVRYWLGADVDGFRLDVFGWIMKDPNLRSNPFRPSFGGGNIVLLWRRDFTENTPDNVALAKELRAACREFEGSGKGAGGATGSERLLVGEVFGSPDEVHAHLGEDDGPTLTFAFSEFPGVYLEAGAAFSDRFPTCDCDASDESVEGTARDLEEVVFGIVAGGLVESVRRGTNLVAGLLVPGASPSRSRRRADRVLAGASRTAATRSACATFARASSRGKATHGPRGVSADGPAARGLWAGSRPAPGAAFPG